MMCLPSLSMEAWSPKKNAVDCTRAPTFTLLVFKAATVWWTYDIIKGGMSGYFQLTLEAHDSPHDPQFTEIQEEVSEGLEIPSSEMRWATHLGRGERQWQPWGMSATPGRAKAEPMWEQLTLQGSLLGSALWPWAGYLTSLCLYEMGIRTVPTSQNSCED